MENRKDNLNVNNYCNRIAYLDFLKFLGLTGIVIAHSDSPEWIMMLRSFDVPLMVFISAFLSNKSYDKYGNTSISLKYLLSRVNRLVFPTWIFLTLFFVYHFLIDGKIYELNYYLFSFGLTRYGIWYVWIILIYLYISILVPIYKKHNDFSKKIWVALLFYILYEGLYCFGLFVDNKLVDTTFYYIIPYGFVGYLGFCYASMNIKLKKLIALLSSLLFLGFMVFYWISFGTFQQVQMAKYPPRIYYLSYGVMFSFALFMFCEHKYFKIYNNSVVRFISMHSMWIYLWHIFFLDVYQRMKLPLIWVVKFLVIYCSSILIVYLINKLLDIIEKRKKIKVLKLFRG